MLDSEMYAHINSRFDCAYTIGNLVDYFSLGLSHIQTLKIIMRYFKGTLIFGIKYQQTSNRDILYGFFNANWEGIMTLNS